MCGIAGICGKAKVEILQKMMAVMHHRGPDDCGVWLESDRVGLAHCRLSIVDLTDAGHQPMVAIDGVSFDSPRVIKRNENPLSLSSKSFVTLVYNGELYNAASLRQEINVRWKERYGRALDWNGHSDTEVLLYAYLIWDMEVLSRLRGMFAFAIWDARKQKLFLARDRFGIKPLYYAFTPEGFVFGSEIKALRATGWVSNKVNKQGVWDYLSLGAVPLPQTILENVFMLPAGHYGELLFKEKSHSPTALRITCYWDMHSNTKELRKDLASISYMDACTEVRRLLEASAECHLIADVPVGAFLSGGMDSTLVVALMRTLTKTPITTFTIGFDHPKIKNEFPWARLAADKLGCCNHEIVVRPHDFRMEFDNILTALDQPSYDGVNTYFVSQAARQKVTVALSGLGGGELFAGYHQYARIPASAKRFPFGIKHLRKVIESLEGKLPGRLLRPLEYILTDRGKRLHMINRLTGEVFKAELVDLDWQNNVRFRTMSDYYNIIVPEEESDWIRKISLTDIRCYLKSVLLRDADAMSMAHSLEIRPILLDHPLAEFAYSLPGHVKIMNGQAKRILYDASSDLVPEEIGKGVKQGFELPLQNWLKNELSGLARDVFHTSAANRFLSKPCQQQIEDILRRPGPCRLPLWPLFILIAFCEKHNYEL
ncbi:MAG TPA: asparagine synthase (glutamine-hydrolyzing) [Verrucomicrobia bacterium]|nr:MAG: asparagine synthase (glutamine-hydrolyzing) [Lentisphaerae bacterium GWF2_57_35]HBA82745.1 asparagine synthase (glutamine-hydrolyzing) [Verrucomicrobiota bacterium]